MAISPEQETLILKVTIGLFNAAPGGTYLTNMANAVDGGWTIAELADFLASFPLFTDEILAGKVTTDEQVGVLMNHFGLVSDGVPGSAATQAEEYFTARIDAGDGFGAIVYDAVLFLSDLPAGFEEFEGAATLLANKALVANFYSESNPSGDLETLQSVFDDVTGDHAYTDEEAQAIADGAGIDEFILTTDLDNPTDADLVKGVVDGDGDGDSDSSTFSVGDIIVGNGDTVLRLAVAEGGDAPFATVQDVSRIDLIAGTADTINFNAADWSGVGSIHYVSGVDDMSVTVENLEAGVGLAFDTTFTDGNMIGSYTDGLMVSLDLSNEGGKVSYLDGAIDANAVDDGSISIDISSTNDITLGDVNATVGSGTSASFWLEVADTGTDDNDITVGDINIVAGDNASASAWIHATSETTDVVNAGNVTVGNVAMEVGTGDTDGYIGLFVTAENITGDLTVGNIDMIAGDESTFSVTISATNTISGESMGDFTVGNINLGMGDTVAGTTSEFFVHRSHASATGDNGIGAFTIGDMTVNLGNDADLDVTIENFLYGTGTGNMGDITIGALDISMGIDSSMSYSIDIDNSITSDINSVAIGDVSVNMDDGASLSYTVSISQSGTGDIVSVDIGNVDVELGVSASIESMSYNISAASGDVKSVTVGDLSAVIGQGSDFDDYSLEIDASNGEITSVAVGAVDIDVAESGSVSYSFSATADDIGDIQFGNITVAATSASSVSFDYNISASSGDVGTVTFADISLTNAGTGAAINFEVNVTATGDAGELTFGDIALTSAPSATVSVSIDATGGTDGNITIGDVALNYGSGTSGDITFGIGSTLTYSGDINIGSIIVSQTVTDDTLIVDLADILADIGTSGTDQLTIGTVDFSGLVNEDTDTADMDTGVLIDVSSIQGDVAVIGSDYDDTIIDNVESNILTGGDGADIFEFDLLNTGKTIATADEITDFNTTDDIIDVNFAFTAVQYGEGDFDTFGAFLTGAAAAMANGAAEDDIFAGQVGSDVYVAIDADGGDAVDYVIKLTGVSTADLDLANFQA